MTFRPQMLAGLIATLAVPALTYASSSGLTTYDIEHGQTALLSGRGFFAANANARKEQAPSPNLAEVSNELTRHQQAMDTGTIRMTTGSMEGSNIEALTEQAPTPKLDAVQERARHQQAMDTGTIRMTTGAMEGTTTK